MEVKTEAKDLHDGGRIRIWKGRMVERSNPSREESKEARLFVCELGLVVGECMWVGWVG